MEIVFVYVIFGLLCVLLFVAWEKPEFRRIAPGIMTSLGILGTFFGIALALQSFDTDPDKMRISISMMLESMKSAFWTSCWGLAFAIGTKCFLPVNPKEEPIGYVDGQIINHLKSIKSAIAENDKPSLEKVLQELREENREKLTQLDGHLNGLANAIRQELVNNLQGLINTIQGVIVRELKKSLDELINRIDKTINEKLGQKLDQFNASVDTVRLWQVQHRAQVRELTDAFRNVAAGIQQIKNDCASIPATMDALRSSVAKADEKIEGLDITIADLDTRLQAFADMKEKAEAAFPAIDNKLNEVLNAMNGVVDKFSQLDKTVEDVHKKAMAEMESSHERAKEVAGNHAKEVENIVVGMRTETEKVIGDLRKELEKQMSGMAHEWGRNLTAIAKECAKVIEQARGTKQ